MTGSEEFRFSKVEIALCRSAMYEALSLGFHTPTKETITRLVIEKQVQALAEIASIVDTGTQDIGLASRVSRLPHCPDAKNVESLQTSYHYLFGHTARSKASPYETEYGEETLFQQPQQLGDISGFFNAFGVQLNVNAHERMDHISCECEFLSFLTRKEAYAIGTNNSAILNETLKAQRLFLKDHLGRFTPSFSKLLLRADPNGFYGELGNLCYDFVRSECVYHNVPIGSEFLRLQSTNLADESFTCGGGEEAINIINPDDIPFAQ